MNKSQLIDAISTKSNLTKTDAGKALEAFTDTIKEELVKGNSVYLVGFGTFEVAERAEHMGRNPATGQVITIAASKSPKFKVSKALKDAVNA